MDFVNVLKASPIEPKSISSYRIWEPETGWTQETMDMIVEMLRRGYDFVLVPRLREQ